MYPQGIRHVVYFPRRQSYLLNYDSTNEIQVDYAEFCWRFWLQRRGWGFEAIALPTTRMLHDMTL